MNPTDRARLGALIKRVWPLIAVLLTSVGVVVVVSDNPGPTPDAPHHHPITVTLGGPGKTKVVLPPAAQTIASQQAKEAAAGKTAAAESSLHEAPEQAPTAAELKQSEKLKPAGQPNIPATLPAATANLPGCSTALVRNYSSRRGAPVLLGVIHWTGSRSIPGSTADGLANVRWFDQPASQASSSEITDDDGHCWLVVPEALKPWTQSAFNSWSVSVEHVNPGAGALFTHPAGRAVVLRIMRGWHHRWHLPYRRAIVTQNRCRVIRSGFLAHRDLGPCGGGHPDVGSFDIDRLIREAAAGDHTARPITSTDRAACRKLNWWRAHRRPQGKAETNAVRRKRALTARGVTCTSKGSGARMIGLERR